MTEFLITSTIIILIVVILRSTLRNHVSHCCIYALWLMVVMRLAIPVTFIHSSFSILNYINGQTLSSLSSNTTTTPKSALGNSYTDTDIHGLSVPVSDMPENTFVPGTPNQDTQNVSPSTAKTSIYKSVLLSVWIFGSIIFVVFFTTVNILFYHKLLSSRQLVEECTTGKINVYLVEDLNSPCVFGLFRPAVYLNSKVLENPKNTEYALAHELCHLRHGDLFWSFIRCLFISIYWFHPLVWCAAILSKRDCEYACDESVLRQYEHTFAAGNEFHAIRTEYGSTLLSLIPQNTFSSFGIASTSMTSRKKLLKQRISYIAQKPKTTLFAVSILIAASLLAIGCTLTSPDNNSLTATDEIQTEPENENHVPDGDFSEMAKHPGDVIYAAPFYDKTLQVVMTDAHYHVLPENTNHLSGSFVIRLLDENMTLISEVFLSSGGFTSELGTHIDVTPEQLENTFELKDDKFIYRIPYAESNETLYATSVYSVNKDGTITRFLPDETIPDELKSPDPDFIITDKKQETADLSFYIFNDENYSISLSENYSAQ